MSSYFVDVGPRSRTVARFIARIRGEILTALNEERGASVSSQQAIADRLDKSRSQINRELIGEAPLTLRSIAELSWILGREIHFELRKPVIKPGQNLNDAMSTAGWTTPTIIATPDGAGSRSTETREDHA